MEMRYLIIAAGIVCASLIGLALMRRGRKGELPKLITEKPRHQLRKGRFHSDFDGDTDEHKLTIIGLNHQETRHLKHLIDGGDVLTVAAFLARHAAKCVELDEYMTDLRKQYLDNLGVHPSKASESRKRRAARRIKYPPTRYWMSFADVHKEDLIYFFENTERDDRIIPPGLIDKFGGEDFIANLSRYTDQIKDGAITRYVPRDSSDYEWMDGLARTGAATRGHALSVRQRLMALPQRALQRRAKAAGLKPTPLNKTALVDELAKQADTEGWLMKEYSINNFFHLAPINVDIALIEREWRYAMMYGGLLIHIDPMFR